MFRPFQTIAGRMWLMAWMMTVMTSFVGLAVYYAAVSLQLIDLKRDMPPKARAEIEQLIATGQTHSSRFFDIYDRYGWSGLRSEHVPALLFIILISTGCGGLIAMIAARRISRPVIAVAQAAARASAGDRTVRVDRGGATREVAQLIDSFNTLVGDVETYERERQILTAGVAHELRTPLTILKGRLHGIEDGVIDPATGEASRLLRQVEHLLTLVADLDTLSQPNLRQLSLDLRVVECGDVMRRVVADIRPVVAARGVSFAESYQSAPVMADPVRLAQIFTNIVANAIKHAPNDHLVTLDLRVEGGKAIASIMDEGPGFAEEMRDMLFTPFWRADANRAAGRPGTGLGLALAARLVEDHGGTIAAFNRQDRSGACFVITLPLAD
jgi:signal transduction histidine kinase